MMTRAQMNVLSACARDARRLARAFANISSRRGDERGGPGRGAALIESAVGILSAVREAAGAPADLEDADPRGDGTDAIDDRLWELTCAVTTLSVEEGLPTSIAEAAAALQEFVCLFAIEPDANVAVR